MAEEPPGKYWREDGILHIDVRGLGPPEPMYAIIFHLEKPGEAGPVIVHHFCEPIYFYPELAEMGWSHKIMSGEPDEVRLILRQIP